MSSSNFKPVKTFAGWHAEGVHPTSGETIAYGKHKGITRGSGAHYYVRQGTSEKRFKLGVGAGVLEKFKKHVESLGVPFNHYTEGSQHTEGDWEEVVSRGPLGKRN